MAPGEIPASLLATGRGIASTVVVRAQPPTALLSVRLALSFPITSRLSASAGWSLGKVFATRLPTAALWPVWWGSPSWVAGPCSGWACYFIGWFLLWCLFLPMRVAAAIPTWPGHTFRVRCSSRLACIVWRPPHEGSTAAIQRLRGRRFSLVATGGCRYVEWFTSGCVKSGEA